MLALEFYVLYFFFKFIITLVLIWFFYYFLFGNGCYLPKINYSYYYFITLNKTIKKIIPTYRRIPEVTKEAPVQMTSQVKTDPDVVPTTSSYTQPSPMPSTSKTVVTDDLGTIQPDTTTPIDTNR